MRVINLKEVTIEQLGNVLWHNLQIEKSNSDRSDKEVFLDFIKPILQNIPDSEEIQNIKKAFTLLKKWKSTVEEDYRFCDALFLETEKFLNDIKDL